MSSISGNDGAAGAPRFDAAVADSGYRWWYVDGISDDGRNSIVIIAFVGSVFSPYYFRARQRGAVDPHDYCSINVGIYAPRSKLWAMTERGRNSVERSADWFRVGPSRLEWHGDRLEIEVRERSMPFARRVTGRIIVRPEHVNERAFPLAAHGGHTWRPIAPSARISVEMTAPALRWEGDGYCDTNTGKRALEDDFRCWDWSRGKLNTGTSITYAVTERDGAQRALALHFEKDGALHETDIPDAVALPSSGWRVSRTARAAQDPSIVRTLEDTPFYARSLLRVDATEGQRLVMHESLDLERFRSNWVRFLLPFRMPRRR